jgi:hypothetical protein
MDRAQPGARGSTNRNIEFGETTGQFSDGWIVPADDPTLSSQRYTSLDETAFNEFAATHSKDSLTVTIDPGEAYVDGWLARDTATEIMLELHTENQVIMLGWDPDAIYNSAQHPTRDAADKIMIDKKTTEISAVPQMAIWSFKTDETGVSSVTDLRRVGPSLAASNTLYDTTETGAVNVIDEDAIGSNELDRTQRVIDNPDRQLSVELGVNESAEIQILVGDGEALEVYRWGAYDGNSGVAPSGLKVQLLDHQDTVHQEANLADEYDLSSPVASLKNTTEEQQVFVLRVKNSTGSPIGEENNKRGVGAHFGYLIEDQQ